MTATLCKTKEKTNTWSNIFPPEQVTAQKSALFVKKLLAVAVSNITYLRAIFPERAYGDRCLEDLSLKILRDDSTCQGACQVIRWVKGCFDALDKKYLRMLLIGIYVDPNDPETVIESYVFKFSYANEGSIEIFRNNEKISQAYTASETKKATMRLLRTIVVLTQSLHSLPDDVMMTMKLLYYDDVTPSDYEPPGFQAAQKDSFYFEDEPVNIKIGDVATPFHTVKLRIKTDSKQFEMMDENEEGTKNSTNKVAQDQPMEGTSPVVTAKVDEDKTITNGGLDADEDSVVVPDEEIADCEEPSHVVSQSISQAQLKRQAKTNVQEVPQPSLADSVPKQDSPNKPCPEEEATQMDQSESISALPSQEEFGVRCPCGCNEDDGLMIMCSECKVWQHGICFKILTEDEAPENHICDMCGNPLENGLKPTDPSLHGLPELAIQATCLWRKALNACTENTRVVVPNLARRLSVEMTVAQGLVNRLEKEGFLKGAAKNKRLGKLVNKEALVEGMRKYFKEDPEKPIGDPEQKQEEVSTEMEKLTNRTNSINLTGRKDNKLSQKASKAKPITENEANVPTPRRGKKRAKPVSQEDLEFEVSQEASVDNNQNGRKKRKASIAAKSIMV